MLILPKSLILITLVLLLIPPTQSLNTNTYIVQRVIPFDMPTQDLKITVEKQLAHNDFITKTFTSNRVEVSKLAYKATYNGKGRIVDPPYESYKHTVTGDSINVSVTYHAVVHPQLTPKAAYDGTTNLRVYFNYTKEIDQNGLVKITNLKSLVDPASFQITYSRKPSPSDKQHLDYINNASMEQTSDTTIYSLLQNQEFSPSTVLKYFNENIVNQRISPTYQSTYQYQFNSLNVSFDMGTAKVENIQHGVTNYMRGTIKNFNLPLSTFLNEKNNIKSDSDYHMLISIGFIKNFISYNIFQNKDWKGYYVDRSRFNSRQFAFKLIDLEFIVNDFSQKYAQYYLNDILFTCDSSEMTSLTDHQTSNKFNIDLKWSCKANIVGVTPSPTVLDFDVTFSHVVSIGLNGNMLTVYVEESKLKDWLFREVGGISVVDQEIAAIHLREYAWATLRGYTIGTNFRIKQGSSTVAFNVDQGLWIG